MGSCEGMARLGLVMTEGKNAVLDVGMNDTVGIWERSSIANAKLSVCTGFTVMSNSQIRQRQNMLCSL